MNRDNKNLVDKFLDIYKREDNYQYKTIYVKPSRFKCIVGFVVSVLFFILMLTFFTLKVLYFVVLLGDLVIVIYYGLNLFTEKGFGLPKNIPVYNDYDTSNDQLADIENEDDSLEFEQNDSRYKVQ